MVNESTILIVDDELYGRDTLSSLLMGFGYKLLIASNGPDALDLAHAHLPDLVLLDVMMPEMDGFQVCQAMRSDPRLADVPIIMVTALDKREARLQGIQSGADDFIVKPFDRMELQARVRTITRLNRYRRIQAERMKFEWVVERADQGYLILDDGGQIRYMNAQARLLLGWEGDLDTADPPSFLNLARKQYQFEPISSWVEWPLITDIELPRYLVSPETSSSLAFWLQVDAVELPWGSGDGLLVQLRSVTDQINMVREQRTFHSLIHHRMRTPVTVILGGLELLGMSGNDNPEFQSAVEIMQRGAIQLKTDIEEVLAHLDAPGRAGRSGGMLLSELPKLLTSISRHLELHRIRWKLPDQIDDLQLALGKRFVEMILLELLTNAQKFHPKGDPAVDIYISLPHPSYVQLRILDDGTHLSPIQLAKVWNPYYQGEKSFSGQTAGLGLGLSTVASIIWGVGGRCRLINRLDSPGIEVTLIVPLFSLPEIE